MDILTVLNRPTQVVTNVLSSLGDQDKRNALEAAWDGLAGRKEIGAREALVNLTGDENILKIKENKNTKLDDIGQFVIDMGLEIIADPTTWIGLGVGAAKKAAQTTAKEASQALITKAGSLADEVLEGTKMIANPEKLELIRQAEDLLKPKPTLGQKALTKIDQNVSKWTRQAIRNLPTREQSEAVIRGLRGLKNIKEKAGGLFNAFKDVTEGLRGQLDQVFGKASLQLDFLKRNINKLDGNIEAIVKKYADALQSGDKLVARKAYRDAVYELYESGYKFSKNADGTLMLTMADAPKGTLAATDIAKDLGDAKRGFRHISRKISKENFPNAIANVRRMVNEVNRKVGNGFLKYTYDNNYIMFYLDIKEDVVATAARLADDVPLTKQFIEAQKAEITQKYQQALRGLKGKKTTGDYIISLGKTPLSEEAKKLAATGGVQLEGLFNELDSVVDQADKFMNSSIENVDYGSAASLYSGKLPGSTRYVRRVRTREYLAELSKANRFEPNPLMKEVVSGTGRELEERLYRGTTKEYNEVLKTFYGAKDDRFSQDLIESLTDYVKVAESRFSMQEVTRMIFGLDIQKGAKGKNVFSRADWAQDSKFLTPVSEMMEVKEVVKDGVTTLTAEAKKSSVVTKEMAEEFKRKFPNHKILDDGFVDVVRKPNGDIEVIGGEFGTLVKGLPKDLQKEVINYLDDAGMLGKKMAVHSSAYGILKNAQNAYKINLNVGVKYFDKFLNTWKELSLLSPAFHIRNFIGNWTNMSMAGLNPKEILEETSNAFRELSKRDELLKKLSDGTITAQEKVLLSSSNAYVSGLSSTRRGVRDLENLAELKRVSPETSQKFVGKAKETYDKVVGANFKLAERADEVQRLAMFNALKKRGLTEAQAIQRVREVLFDYGKLTGFEKDVMKRIFPFYTFMKENMIFQFKNSIQNSGRYKNLFRGYKHYLEEVADIQAEDMPSYMSGNMWLPLPFMVNKNDKEAISFLKLNLPASDFFEFVEDPLKKTSSSIAVPIKAGWEFLTGVDAFTGAPIEQFKGERSIMREGDSLFKFLRNEKGEFDISKSPVIKKFSDDLGLRTLRKPLTAILDSIDTLLGKKDVKQGLFDLLEQSGITTTKTKEEINITSLYQQLEYLRNLKKLYEQNTNTTLPTNAAIQAGYKFKPK